MKKLFYDCETSGLPDFKAPSAAPHQPQIIQLAAILVDADGTELAIMDKLIKLPDGQLLDPKITELTGITDADLQERGEAATDVISVFWAMFSMCDTLVAHNDDFDGRMVRIMLHKFEATAESIEAWEDRTSYCTMKNSTAIVNLPPTPKMIAAGFRKPKSPKLEEAYAFFHDGAKFEGAHNALSDVRATIAVYDKLQAMQPKAA